MNQIHAQSLHYRYKQRRQDNQRCSALQEHAQNQKQDVDNHKHHILILRDTQEQLRQHLGNTLPAHIIAEYLGGHDNQDNRAGSLYRLSQYERNMRRTEILIYKSADNNTI